MASAIAPAAWGYLLRSTGVMVSADTRRNETSGLSEYDRWAKKHPNDASMMGGFLFFRYLQKERSDLLDFRAVGDKWQIVHGWLRVRLKD